VKAWLLVDADGRAGLPQLSQRGLLLPPQDGPG
jgi:hypothetical protein